MSETLSFPTLLVIDDNTNLLFSLKEFLSRASYQVITARDGRESLETLQAVQPDLIICDVMMPPPNGFELKRMLNEDVKKRDIPFIFLSARSSRADMLYGMRNGADDYLTKPFDPDLLLEKIKAVLRRTRGQQSAQLQRGEEAAPLRVSEADGHGGDVAGGDDGFALSQAALAQAADHVEQLRAFKGISEHTHSDLTLERALQLVLMRLAAALGADSVELWRYNPELKQMQFALSFARDALAAEKNGPCESGKVFWTTAQPSQVEVRSSQFFPVFAMPGHTAPLRVSEADAKAGRNWSLRACYAELARHVEHSTFVDLLIEQLAVILDRETILEQLRALSQDYESSHFKLIEGVTKLIDLRDQPTGNHSARVEEKAVRLARKLGVSEEGLERIRIGALTHDLGKVGIPDQILNKDEKLSEDEWLQMKMHPVYAADLLSKFGFSPSDLEIPLHHHERWDGSGYPAGLSGGDIPLEVQIFSICDVWDALTNDRPYRQAYSSQAARDILLAQRGTTFQAGLVDSFFDMLDRWED